jgi:hypothetical protein
MVSSAFKFTEISPTIGNGALGLNVGGRGYLSGGSATSYQSGFVPKQLPPDQRKISIINAVLHVQVCERVCMCLQYICISAGISIYTLILIYYIIKLGWTISLKFKNGV